MFGESFYISKKTTSHQGPDMAKTYTEILNAIRRSGTHTKVAGRKSDLDAADLMNKGIASILATAKNVTAEGTGEEGDDEQPGASEGVGGEVEIDGEDLMLDDD